MDQSNKIFAAVSIAFIVYITMKGELPTYLTFLRGGGAQANGGSGGSGGSSSGGLGGLISGALSLAPSFSQGLNTGISNSLFNISSGG